MATIGPVTNDLPSSLSGNVEGMRYVATGLRELGYVEYHSLDDPMSKLFMGTKLAGCAEQLQQIVLSKAITEPDTILTKVSGNGQPFFADIDLERLETANEIVVEVGDEAPKGVTVVGVCMLLSGQMHMTAAQLIEDAVREAPDHVRAVWLTARNGLLNVE